MATPEAKVKMAVGIAEAVAEMRTLARKWDSTFDRMDKSLTKTNKTSEKTSQSLGQWAGKITKAAGASVALYYAMQGLRGIATAIREQFAQIEEFQTKSRDRTLEWVAAMERVARAMPVGELRNMSAVEVAEKIRKDPEIAAKVPAANLYEVLSGAATEEKATDIYAIMKATSKVYRKEMLLGDTEGAFNMGKQAMIQMRYHPGTTAEEQLGMMWTARSQARTESAQAFAENIAPLAQDLSRFGYSQRGAWVLGSTMGNLLSDPSGQRTRTSSTAFASVLFSQLLSQGIDAKNMTGIEQMQFIKSDTPEARQARMALSRLWGADEMTDEEKQELAKTRKGMPALMGRMTSKSAQVAMMDPWREGSVADKEFKTALDQIPASYDAALKTYHKIQGEAARLPGHATVELYAATEAARQDRETSEYASFRGQAFETLAALPEMFKGLKFATKLRTLPEQAIRGEIGLSDAVDMLLKEMKFLRDPSSQRPYQPMGPGFYQQDRAEQIKQSADREDMVRTLDQFIKVVEGLKETMEEQQRNARPQPVQDVTPRLDGVAPAGAAGLGRH